MKLGEQENKDQLSDVLLQRFSPAQLLEDMVKQRLCFGWDEFTGVVFMSVCLLFFFYRQLWLRVNDCNN